MILNNINVCEFCFDPIHNNSGKCPNCMSESNLVKYPTSLSEGSILAGKYLVGKVLGKGGFGITYLCYDIRNNKKVAIKEYLPDSLSHRNSGESTVSTYGGDKENLFRNGAQRFFDEARLVSNFNGNPNIISVYEFFYENNTTYFVMEYLSGTDLKVHLKNNKTITENEAVYIAKRTIDALLIVHSTNTLHRDIAPDNIFLCEDGSVKLIDFGASRHIIANESKSLSVILKHGYAPFEQYQSKGKQGPWTDIYALGVTLYSAITGIMPDEAMSRLDNPDLDMNGISEEFALILTKMMAVKAEDRYQNIMDLKADFDKLTIAPIAPVVTRVKKHKYCSGCGTPIDESEKLCPDCKKEREGAVPVVAPVHSARINQTVKKEKKRNSGLILALCAVGVLLIAAVVIIIILLSGSQGNSNPSDQYNSGSEFDTGSNVVDVSGITHSHIFDQATVIKEATCTEEGIIEYHCSVQYCQVTQRKTTPKLDHTFSNPKVTKEATCTETGSKTYYCSCGATKVETIAKTEHNYSTSEVTKEPTATSDGVRTYICSCGARKSEKIPREEAHTHDFTNPTVTKEPTCTEEGECVYTCSCGEEKIETIARKAHSYGTPTVTRAATCTAEGLRVSYCSCGDVKYENIPKIAHTFLNPTVTKEPTVDEEGIRTYYCSCGATKTETIAKLSGSEIDQAISLFNSKKYSESLPLFKKLAEQGNTTAQFYYGYSLMCALGTEEDRPKACEWLQKAADSNNADAQYYLASAYGSGNGAYFNETTAFSLYKKAAESGNLYANIALGIYYYEGRGVKKDVSVAGRYIYENLDALKKAAESGDNEAQVLLSYLFFYGYYVTEDEQSAKNWCKQAADADYIIGQGEYALICYYLGDYADAVTYSTKAANRGSALGNYILGICNYYGNGTKMNDYYATTLFLKAASKNYMEAQMMVAQCYYYGWAVAINYNVAFEYYNLAALHNLPEAQNMVGRCYMEGWGVAVDYEMAVEWFEKAAYQNLPVAIYNLAFCYAYGYGVYGDLDVAADMLRHVIEIGDEDLVESARDLLDYVTNGKG